MARLSLLRPGRRPPGMSRGRARGTTRFLPRIGRSALITASSNPENLASTTCSRSRFWIGDARRCGRITPVCAQHPGVLRQVNLDTVSQVTRHHAHASGDAVCCVGRNVSLRGSAWDLAYGSHSANLGRWTRTTSPIGSSTSSRPSGHTTSVPSKICSRPSSSCARLTGRHRRVVRRFSRRCQRSFRTAVVTSGTSSFVCHQTTGGLSIAGTAGGARTRS